MAQPLPLLPLLPITVPVLQVLERGERLRLALAGDPAAALEPARLAVHDFLAPQGLGAAALYSLELVLEETLLNLAWHAAAQPAALSVLLDVQVRPDQVVLHFEDDGIAFDPTLAAEAPAPATLQDARPGGLGLKLVRRLAQQVVHRHQEGRNHLVITIARWQAMASRAPTPAAGPTSTGAPP